MYTVSSRAIPTSRWLTSTSSVVAIASASPTSFGRFIIHSPPARASPNSLPPLPREADVALRCDRARAERDVGRPGVRLHPEPPPTLLPPAPPSCRPSHA